MSTTEEKLRELLAASVDATVEALNALRRVLDDSETDHSTKIKAAQQIANILNKAIDNIDLMEKAKQIKDVIDTVAENHVYDPEY